MSWYLDPVRNFAIITVSTGYDSAAVSIALSSGGGAKLPQPSTDGPFNLVWWNSTDYTNPADDPNVEIVRCTARSTDTLTITRGQESTSPANHNIGGKTYKVILALTKKTIDDIDAAGAGTINVVCTGTNDHTAIQEALDAIPAEGKRVKLVGPVAGIGATLLMGNGGGTGYSTRNGITLKGDGIGRSNFLGGGYGGATILRWTGASGGTLLKVNGAVDGCALDGFVLDGNNLASCLLDVNFGFHLNVNNILGYKWQGGYAVQLHSTGGFGAGVQEQTWNHVHMVDPYGANANGLDIASAGSGNICEVTYNSCHFQRSGNDTSIGLRLGYTDHVIFNRTFFYPTDGRLTGIGIQVEPISGYASWPTNITFIGSPIFGGIKYVNTYPWTQTVYPALIFYPYYSADAQPIPPLDYVGGLLPLNMVIGQTDSGAMFGIRTLGLRGASPTLRLTRPDGTKYWDIINNESDAADFGLSFQRNTVEYMRLYPAVDANNPLVVMVGGVLKKVTIDGSGFLKGV